MKVCFLFKKKKNVCWVLLTHLSLVNSPQALQDSREMIKSFSCEGELKEVGISVVALGPSWQELLATEDIPPCLHLVYQKSNRCSENPHIIDLLMLLWGIPCICTFLHSGKEGFLSILNNWH